MRVTSAYQASLPALHQGQTMKHPTATRILALPWVQKGKSPPRPSPLAKDYIMQTFNVKGMALLVI